MANVELEHQLDLLREKLQKVEQSVRGSVSQYTEQFEKLKAHSEEQARRQAVENADLKCQLAVFNELTKELLSAYKSNDKTALEDVILKFTSMVT